jgi:hypothetical protein
MADPIPPSALKELVAAQALQAAMVIGDAGGYHLLVRYGRTERVVAARTRAGALKPRLFRSLDAAARFLRGIGIVRYEVDAGNFQEGPARTRRPDRAEALRRAHEAAAHDQWFRAEVEAALREMDDPAHLISEKQHQEWLKAKREALQARILSEGS